MDNELDESQAGLVREHLAVCSDCALVCEDLSSLLFTVANEPADEIVPPNSQALWCTINNIIESEIKLTLVQPEPPTKDDSGNYRCRNSPRPCSASRSSARC